MFAAGMPLQVVGAWLILNLGRNDPRSS